MTTRHLPRTRSRRRPGRGAAGVVAWTMGLGTGGSADVARADDPVARREVPGSASVRVDTHELGDAFEELAARVSVRSAPIAHQAGYDTVQIWIFWKSADEFHYAIAVALEPEQSLEQAPIAATCRDCSSSQLEDAAILAVETAIAQHRARHNAAATTSPAPEPLVPPPSESVEPPARRDPRAPLGVLGKAGVAGLAVGLPTVATGIAFVALDERRPENDMSQVRKFRPPGWGVLAAGGVLSAAGVVMLVLDRRSAFSPPGPTARRAPVLWPWVGPRGAGVGGVF